MQTGPVLHWHVKMMHGVLDLVVEVVEDDWSHDQSNTLSNQLHQRHTCWVRHTCWIGLDLAGLRTKLAALLQHTTIDRLHNARTQSEARCQTTQQDLVLHRPRPVSLA